MDAAADILWYNVLVIFGIYSILLGLLVKIFKITNILGAVYAVSLLLAYATRDIMFSLLPIMSQPTCIYIAVFGLLATNFLVESGHSAGKGPPGGL